MALGKCTVVRPFGIGEIMRHTTESIIVDCIRQDLTSLGRNMCLGQKCGIEHAIDSLRHSFDDPENGSFPLFDAKHTFNVLIRRTESKNLKVLCPFLHFALQISYSHPSYLYFGKSTILVQESKTQGEPLAMAINGIAIRLLITRLANTHSVWSQVWISCQFSEVSVDIQEARDKLDLCLQAQMWKSRRALE